MISINGQDYEVLYYVEKINLFKANLDKAVTTMFAVMIAKILMDALLGPNE